jgi:S-DNA-T family DNA segregation ATPase FtsK/SpoIIIE
MSRRRSSSPIDFTLDRHTAHGILTVVIFAIAGILLLSIFELAGRMGVAVDAGMAGALGWDRIILPFFLIAIGIHEISPERLPLKVTNYIGFLLFFFTMNPFVQTVSNAPSADAYQKLGGRIGVLISDPLVAMMGSVGAGVLFFAFLVIAMLLIFNTSLRRVVEVVLKALGSLKFVGAAFAAPFKWIAAKQRERKEEQIRAQSVSAPVPLPVQQRVVATAARIQEVGGDDEETSEEEEEDAEAGEVETPRVHVVQPKPKKCHPKVEVPIELLTKRDQKPTSGDLQHNQAVIQRTLETFGIPVEMGEVAVGPTVTQFTLKPSEGVKLTRITSLHNDLALALAAHPIRIEAPIPGKSLVGVEVPNQSVATVGLRETLETKEWREKKAMVPFALGRDVSGKAWIADLGRMPHLLVAGSTGSGKSVCLNVLITSLLYTYGPDDLKMILVDPKRVELQVYNGAPHLITPVITDTEKTVNALKWTLREMDHRFDVLSKFGARDITSYNARSEEKLPYIVFIIDELADLMITAMAEVEGPVVRLAQMARAVGIHLVLATQRPSVDVITGLIKANIPARIAFAVASSTDSRTILDQTGAEKLLGRGDMLFQTSDMSTAKRIQGAFISDDEIARVIEFLKSKYEPAEYDPSVVERQRQGGGTSFNGSSSHEDSDELIPEAKEEILRAGKASASLLQRRLKVGYARAARLLDLLEQEGFIGPGDGAKPREILKADFMKHSEPPRESFSHPALDQVNAEIPDIEAEDEDDA